MQAKILYIEDDIIDVMSFKRQLANQQFWTFQIETDIAKIDTNYDSDIIITDANFVHGTYLDVLIKYPNQKIIVISGSNIDNNTKENKNILFFNKPIDINNIFDSIYKVNTSGLEEMSNGDKEFVAEMIALTKEELEINLKSLFENYNANNNLQLRFFAHKLKSKINLIKIPCYEDCCFMEDNYTDITNPDFLNAYYKVKFYCLIALYQLHIITK